MLRLHRLSHVCTACLNQRWWVHHEGRGSDGAWCLNCGKRTAVDRIGLSALDFASESSRSEAIRVRLALIKAVGLIRRSQRSQGTDMGDWEPANWKAYWANAAEMALIREVLGADPT